MLSHVAAIASALSAFAHDLHLLAIERRLLVEPDLSLATKRLVDTLGESGVNRSSAACLAIVVAEGLVHEFPEFGPRDDIVQRVRATLARAG